MIPVWLGVSRDDVAKFNPALADLVAIVGNPDDINMESADIETKHKILDVLLRFSIGDHERVFSDADAGKIDSRVLAASVEAWLNVVPSVTISDVDEAG